jgi:hypothetical protein
MNYFLEGVGITIPSILFMFECVFFIVVWVGLGVGVFCFVGGV